MGGQRANTGHLIPLTSLLPAISATLPVGYPSALPSFIAEEPSSISLLSYNSIDCLFHFIPYCVLFDSSKISEKRLTDTEIWVARRASFSYCREAL